MSVNIDNLIKCCEKNQQSINNLLAEINTENQKSEKMIDNYRKIAVEEMINASLSLIVEDKIDQTYSLLKDYLINAKFNHEQRSEFISRLIFRVSDVKHDAIKKVDKIIELLLHEGLED